MGGGGGVGMRGARYGRWVGGGEVWEVGRRG